LLTADNGATVATVAGGAVGREAARARPELASSIAVVAMAMHRLRVFKTARF
jgi:hypothetical protein